MNKWTLGLTPGPSQAAWPTLPPPSFLQTPGLHSRFPPCWLFRTPKEQNSRDRNDFLLPLPSEPLVLLHKVTCGSCVRRLGSGAGLPMAGCRPGLTASAKRPVLSSDPSDPSQRAGLGWPLRWWSVYKHTDLAAFPLIRAPLLRPGHLEEPSPPLCVPASAWRLLLLSFWPSLPLAPLAGFIPPRLPVTLSSLSSLPIPQMTFFRALCKSRAAWQGLSSSSFLLSHQKRHLIWLKVSFWALGSARPDGLRGSLLPGRALSSWGRVCERESFVRLGCERHAWLLFQAIPFLSSQAIHQSSEAQT